MKQYLIKTSTNWGDEMDLDGFIILDEKELEEATKEMVDLAAKDFKAEDIFYKKYPTSCKVNYALWESYRPLSFQNKADIEDCERKIEMYKEKLEKLKKETPKDLVKVEIGFEEC